MNHVDIDLTLGLDASEGGCDGSLSFPDAGNDTTGNSSDSVVA